MTDLISPEESRRLVQEAYDESYAAGRAEGLAEARAQGAAEARDRIAAILADPAAQGRGALARHLAFHTAMSPDDVAGVLLAAPTEAAAARCPSLSALMKSAPDTFTGVPYAPGAGAAPIDARERGRQIALRAKGKV